MAKHKPQQVHKMVLESDASFVIPDGQNDDEDAFDGAAAHVIAFAGEDMHTDEKQITMSHLVEEMVAVANGKHVTDLRKIVAELCPKDPSEAARFRDVIMRLRQSGEVAYQTACEAYSNALQKR